MLYSYAEVRAEQRRELGIEESQPEIIVDKVRLLSELWDDGSDISDDDLYGDRELTLTTATFPPYLTAIPGFTL